MNFDSPCREPLAPKTRDNLVGMVAYEDLVVALTNWRINQGLPTGADAFAAFETGSVDLALPVADPVELNTGEVLAIEDDGAIEEVSEESYEAIAEEVAAIDPRTEPESLESFADDEQAVSLDYGEETAYGEVPDMGEADAVAPQDIAAEAVEEAPMEATDAAEVSYEADPSEELAEEAQGEVAMDASAEEEIAADAMDIEEEVVDSDPQVEAEMADELPVVEEEVNADDFDAIEVDANEFEAEEVPVDLGAEKEGSEATVMGLGVDQIVPPDEA